MKFTIPELSFVVLIGVSGSGKSTFARKHFKPTEILSSDYCRGLVSDDENSQAATKDAFEVLHFIARKRLAAGKLTVVDATNVQPESRKSLIAIAREFHCLPVAIVLDLPERVAHDRNKMRPDRDFGPHVIRQQSQQLHRSLRGLEREGFRHVHVLKSLEENAVASGAALCVPGNHDAKLMRKLRGREVQITHGLAESLAQLASESEDFRKHVAEFIDDLVSHYVLDDGKLVIAHAGMKESMQGRGSGAVREFALFGETTGETDEFGLPVRYNWAAEYRGTAAVVYGHTPVPEPEWLNRTINIDTGCVFGGKLTALRYPEMELVSVPAKQTYAESRKPFLPPEDQAPTLSAQQQNDDLLDLADVTSKRIVSTRLHGNVTIREENSIAALEVMSRFAANPKWLIYLPPTMSPCETSQAPGLLEHPAEAFAYFRHAGVPRVVCEEKHMGSRAVVVICRDEDAARKIFGVTGEGIGICYTRTGRRFFDNATLEGEFLERVRAAATAAGFWDEFKTDWLCLDCELMPWSAKAQELVKQQYAAVGTSAQATLAAEVAALEQAAARGLDVGELLTHTTARRQMVSDYIEAYRRYCWPVNSVNDLKLAPFHLLASEGKVHADKPNDWHMQTLARLAGGIIIATPFRVIDVTNPESEAEGIRWWEELTGRGGEGMVVKPLEFIAKSRRGLVQPAVKCRGREYLRIIYGPEYAAAENLERLRARGLSTKRSLALREFALGIESLERFVRKEPLRRVHEAVFGVLALESEPVDPRL
ncbi:MAG: polynucleotide kinase-phosphatase [Verrucomicrobia bacterium]|nr:polynucleotide kinase-phosphatase [Verrucomicrobiota bacterium]